jgi:formate--tetrahydrofolate ligase
MNIKCRKAGLAPDAVVLVATVRAMKMNGGVAKADLGAENVEAVQKGCANLGRHIRNVKSFGVPVVVGINHFAGDTDAEIAGGEGLCGRAGVRGDPLQTLGRGGAGIEEMAHRWQSLPKAARRSSRPLYPDEMPLFEKIERVAKSIYHASEVIADKKVRDQLQEWEAQGYGNLPVCMAKTQYSFSTDPNLRGAPEGHTLPIREVRLSAGRDLSW